MTSATNQLLIVGAFIAVLYYLTIPGVIITLPSESSDKMIKNITHSIVFAAVFIFSYQAIVKQVAKL
jgi:hypothetical protein